MLKEAMKANRVTDMEYAEEFCRLLKSAETDLRMAGVDIPGTCDFTITETEDQTTGETTVAKRLESKVASRPRVLDI